MFNCYFITQCLTFILLLNIPAFTQSNPDISDRELDGLVGPVKGCRVEALIKDSPKKSIEWKTLLLEESLYDTKGKKIDSLYYPVGNAGCILTREVYKYDDKGNIIEMYQKDSDGKIIYKEIYLYEFDKQGNWITITTMSPNNKDGLYEIVDITFRHVEYYLDK